MQSHLSNQAVHWTTWFRDVGFYQYGMVYMSVRIVCNVTSVENIGIIKFNLYQVIV